MATGQTNGCATVALEALNQHLAANAEVKKAEAAMWLGGNDYEQNQDVYENALSAACDVEFPARVKFAVEVAKLPDDEFIRALKYLFEIESPLWGAPSISDHYGSVLVALAERFEKRWTGTEPALAACREAGII